MESPLVTLSNELAAHVENMAPSVVTIHGRRLSPSSGVPWRQDLIVTAEHTINRDEDITITFPRGESAKARSWDATGVPTLGVRGYILIFASTGIEIMAPAP
jgi:hypothetical protein